MSSFGINFLVQCRKILPPGNGDNFSLLSSYVSSTVKILVYLSVVCLQKIAGKIGDVWNHHELPVVREIMYQMDAKIFLIRTQSQTMGAGLTFLKRYHNEANEYFNRISSSDEMWADSFDKSAVFPLCRLLWQQKLIPRYHRCFSSGGSYAEN